MSVTRSRKSRPAPNAPIVLRRGRGRLRVRRPQRETSFDLLSTVARDGIDPGMPEPSWPSGDAAFLTAVLRAQRVPEPLVQKISAAIPLNVPSNTTLPDRLAEALAIVVDFGLLLAGPAGAGKTTLAGKIAVRSDRQDARFVDARTGRVGGQAQLAEYAATLGLPLIEADSPEALAGATHGRTEPFVVDTHGIDAADGQAWESLRPCPSTTRSRPPARSAPSAAATWWSRASTWCAGWAGCSAPPWKAWPWLRSASRRTSPMDSAR
jgi:hypothetical protein